MSQEFKIEIITPDKSVYAGMTEEAVLPCFEGQITILKDHISLITFLRPGFIIIKSNVEKKFFVEDGTVEFANNNLLVLTSTAVDLDNFDRSSIENLIKECEQKLDNTGSTDKEKYLLSYKIDTLKEFVNLKIGKLEKTESLEQLRALENGIEIIVGKVNKAPYSIDTSEDLKFFLKNELIK